MDFSKFEDKSIMVIGDIMIDNYVWGRVERISPEAPVPVVRVTNRTRTLGGAGNVINNLYSIGIKPVVCAVVGNDSFGSNIIFTLESMSVDIDNIIVDKKRPTTVKTRIISGNQHIIRIDEESIEIVPDKEIISFIQKNIDNVDAIIISDYGKGMISDKVTNEIRKLKGNKFVAVDPKKENYNCYRYFDIVTPNEKELSEYHNRILDKDDIKSTGWGMMLELQLDNLLVTLGKDGMLLFEGDKKKTTHIPTVAKEVYDVTGAGDTVISVLTACMATGMDLESSARFANECAGIVVSEIGTTVIDRNKYEKNNIAKNS
uniref:Putative carbohydrate kinase n=1 Tax=viral metagenome TaxID=1070528 RepID=A0A6M3KT89_9ZZZZ